MKCKSRDVNILVNISACRAKIKRTIKNQLVIYLLVIALLTLVKSLMSSVFWAFLKL